MIFGKKVILPPGVISDIDTDEEKVYVYRTKDEIKNAPELDDSLMHDSVSEGSFPAAVAIQWRASDIGDADQSRDPCRTPRCPGLSLLT